MFKRECENCLEEFETEDKEKIFCSIECQELFENEDYEPYIEDDYEEDEVEEDEIN